MRSRVGMHSVRGLTTQGPSLQAHLNRARLENAQLRARAATLSAEVARLTAALQRAQAGK